MKAMLLAAGRGERMRPLTDTTPKALLEAGGRPLVAWTIERLRRAGIGEVVINVSHLGERIRSALGDGASLGVSIAYSHEPEALETAGGIAHALPLLGAGAFIAVAADIYCDYDYSRLAARENHLTAAHLVLVPSPPHHGGGDFGLAGATVTDGPGERYTFSGIGLYRPSLFARVARGERLRLAVLLREAIARREVTGELYSGDWRDIGTPERLAALDLALRAGRARDR